MGLIEFHATLTRFSSAANIEDITGQCEFYSRELGFDYFIYALRVPTHFSDSKLVLLNGYPKAWVEHYFDHEYYKIDPVMAYCANHIVPVQWRDLNLAPMSAAERFMREAEEFGLKSGITMPVHSPHGELGILSFALNRPAKTAREITGCALPYIQIVAAYLHEAVRRVSGLAEITAKLQLTQREQECLRWVADGKTSWEIGQLMRTSERTVNFHINNAMLKLDVSNRQHAVAKAALQGLIHPCPF